MATMQKSRATAATAPGTTAQERAQKITEPTVGQALQFLLPVLKTARPGADLFTAVVAHGFGGASHV